VLAFISLGILSYNLHLPKNNTRHYSHFLAEDNSENTIIYKVEKRLKPNQFYAKYYVEILKVNNTATIGTALLQLKKDTTKVLQIDDVFITQTKLIPVLDSPNPDQFNYKDYLNKQGVYDQFYGDKNSAILLSRNTHTLKGYASAFRDKINTNLKQYNFSNDELSIINALLLGQRQDISKSVYDSYTNAGAIHILAVSGLHIGIILLILNLLLKPIERLKHGKILKSFIIVVLLWSYAIIAGGSASIIRATTMFSIIAIAINLRRITNIYNTLITSVFIILLIKPLFLFDVGFQLSYAAVFAIVAFQPLIAKLWLPKHKTTNFLWQTFTVTVAAQFGVLPVSLYYFHQFPSLFWLSNLVIIPLLGIILGIGILVLCLALFNVLPSWLADVFSYIIRTLTKFLQWISSQETFLISDISFNIFNLITSLILIITFYMLWKSFKPKNIIFLLITVIGFQLSITHSNWTNRNSELVIFHKSKQTQIGLKEKATLYTFNSDSLNKGTITRSYKVANFIKSEVDKPIPNIIYIENKTLLIIDSLGIYKDLNFNPDYVLLRNSPKINMERLLEKINPKKIIADGSNYKSYIKRWKETFKNKKGLFHTTEKGAFILKF